MTSSDIAKGAAAWSRPRLVLHSRHPLDQLVSEFYSFAYNHPVPHGSEGRRRAFLQNRKEMRLLGVDAYVMKQLSWQLWWDTRYGLLLAWLRDPGAFGGWEVMHSTYEDMVTEFSPWVHRLVAFVTAPESTLQQEDDSALVRRVAGRLAAEHAQSFRPDSAHKRRVLPGSHLLDLRNATITAAWVQHGGLFRALGYEKASE